MFKELLMRKMLERQLKGVPKEEQEKLIALITKNPDFFKKIAEKVKAKTDSGVDQMTATMAVMKEHQHELAKIKEGL